MSGTNLSPEVAVIESGAGEVRITGVVIHRLSARLSRPFGWSLNWAESRTATLVEVTTNTGLTGWGDGHWGGRRLTDNPGLVIGRSPLEVESIHDDLRPEAGHQSRRGEAAAGGLDVALWDLCGQLLGRPVWSLLGQRHHSSIEPYLTALYRQDWPDLGKGLAAEAAEWKDQGWRRIKMKTGYGPEADLKAVASVRQAVGDEVSLAIDSNCCYDAGTARGIGRRLEEFGLAWWEEPLLADDLDGYDRLAAQCAIPLAGGETLSADRLILDYIQPRRVDILQPDLETVGLTGGRRLSYLCWLNRIRLIPHNWGTALRTVATLHWLAVTPPVTEGLESTPTLFEYDQTESPFRDAVLSSRLQQDPESKAFAVPQEPGLGVQVDRRAVERFEVERITIVLDK
jgi:D-galactarolactone cycloisomerase